MAIVTGITAERMQAYMDENVTSGHINEMGNLVLVTRSGAEIDAGSSIPNVPLATDTEPGRVEFADNAEAIAGVATDRAVTPWNLKNLPGYTFWQRIKYTSSGTFQKATYTGMKMIRVIVLGAGGSGGGAAAAGSGNHSAGGGGGGGGYSEKILYFDNLAASETITIGAGGTGGNGAGSTGGTSSFGTHAVATGGAGGQIFVDHPLMPAAPGGIGGIGTVGDLLIQGGMGGMGSGHATLGHGGIGGPSVLGGGGVGAYTASGSGGQAGGVGGNYGGGGGGASANAFATVRAGGTGAPGIVIVEVYL